MFISNQNLFIAFTRYTRRFFGILIPHFVVTMLVAGPVLQAMPLDSIEPALTIASASGSERLRQRTTVEARQKLEPILHQYCRDGCQIIDFDIIITEAVSEVSDLGFEGIEPGNATPSFYVEKITANIQVDKAISQSNRDKLLVLLNNQLRNMDSVLEYPVSTLINWVPVELPQVGTTGNELHLLKEKLRTATESSLVEVIQNYCPTTCVLANIEVSGSAIDGEEADQLDPRTTFAPKGVEAVLKVDKVDISLSLDRNLSEEERQNILALMKAKTKFVVPVAFDVELTAFPESQADRKRRLEASSSDPYGLEKLRRMLTLFKELAGTKEIISSSQSSNSSEGRTEGFSSQHLLIIAGIALFVLGLIAFLSIRFAQANRDAKILMHAYEGPRAATSDTSTKKSGMPRDEDVSKNTSEDLKNRLQLRAMKEELTDIFLNAPKVAKETFSRLLSEEGVEETSKYVHIFGKMIVFELLSDPSLQRGLYELSEYYHKSSFHFTPADELRLLISLRTKVTANEIRVLTRQTIDQFDFLLKLDANQLFSLIHDENPQVQAIVLAQASPARRRSLFDLFEGKAKIQLMNQLCKADTIPREYLFNVATALAKKALAKPELDTQSFRSSEIMLDLLEKASLEEQRSLMANLADANREAARVIKLKLVTIHMLPYLKDGHLLELVLGLEREDLLLFLGGCPEPIQNLIISHAPSELAESWLEDMRSIPSVDEARYRLVEMVVLGKIRLLASNGAINLLEINELIFKQEEKRGRKERPQLMNPNKGKLAS